MTEVLLFHHAHGLTQGVRTFAEVLQGDGHVVHLPDLYEGRVFDELEQGLAYAGEVGFGVLMERGRAAGEGLPNALVYAGFSLGVMPAQMLAQTHPGAVGALLFHSCIPVSEFGDTWPPDVPVQIHGMDADRSSSTRATSTPPARWSTPHRTQNCSCIPAICICSRTTACRRTTRPPQDF